MRVYPDIQFLFDLLSLSFKGRFFFACNNARDNQCKFFKWADDSACGKVNSSSATTVTSGTQDRTGASKKLSSGLSLTDGASIGTFFKGRRLQVYCESIFLRKVPDAFKSQRSNATVSMFRNNEMF